MNAQQFLIDLGHAMARKNISQQELCRKSGISQGTISKLISGKIRYIRLDSAISLWPFVYGAPFPEKKRDA